MGSSGGSAAGAGVGGAGKWGRGLCPADTAREGRVQPAGGASGRWYASAETRVGRPADRAGRAVHRTTCSGDVAPWCRKIRYTFGTVPANPGQSSTTFGYPKRWRKRRRMRGLTCCGGLWRMGPDRLLIHGSGVRVSDGQLLKTKGFSGFVEPPLPPFGTLLVWEPFKRSTGRVASGTGSGYQISQDRVAPSSSATSETLAWGRGQAPQ